MRNKFTRLTFGVCCLTTWLVVPTNGAEKAKTPAPTGLDASGATNLVTSAPRAGREVHLDPQTGQLMPKPARVPALPGPRAADPNTSGEGLIETPGLSRGGGVKVNLQGRFRSTSVVTIGPDGRISTRCQTPLESSVNASAAQPAAAMEGPGRKSK